MLDAIARATKRLDEVRASVRWADAALANLTSSPGEKRAASEIIASSFVAVSGATEQFYRQFVTGLAAEIDSRAVFGKNLRISLHALVSTPRFRALQDVRQFEKMFDARLALLDETASATSCTLSLSADELALGGESIRPQHVANVWRLFGLPNQAFGHPDEAIAMRVVADNRNDYAHGKVSIDQFLQSPECVPSTILRRVTSTERWYFHCWQSYTDYLTTRSYRR